MMSPMTAKTRPRKPNPHRLTMLLSRKLDRSCLSGSLAPQLRLPKLTAADMLNRLVFRRRQRRSKSRLPMPGNLRMPWRGKSEISDGIKRHGTELSTDIARPKENKWPDFAVVQPGKQTSTDPHRNRWGPIPCSLPPKITIRGHPTMDRLCSAPLAMVLSRRGRIQMARRLSHGHNLHTTSQPTTIGFSVRLMVLDTPPFLIIRLALCILISPVARTAKFRTCCILLLSLCHLLDLITGPHSRGVRLLCMMCGLGLHFSPSILVAEMVSLIGDTVVLCPSTKVPPMLMSSQTAGRMNPLDTTAMHHPQYEWRGITHPLYIGFPRCPLKLVADLGRLERTWFTGGPQ